MGKGLKPVREFKKVKNISDFKKENLEKGVFGKFEFEISGKKILVIDYLYQNPEVFEDWENREFRGITFNLETGELISRPFHKFFNIGELDIDPDREIKIKWIMDKLDGSMIHPVLLDGDKREVIFKTRKSPKSDVAIGFTNWISEQEWYSEFIDFNKEMVLSGITPIFEFYHPRISRIVLDYGAPFVRLIGLRKMEDGNYIDDLEFLEKEIKPNWKNLWERGIVKLPVEFDTMKRVITVSDLVELAKVTENKEGWVIVDEYGERYKLKVPWYLERHKYFKITPKQIVEWYFSDELDDVLSMLKILNYHDRWELVIKIKNRIDEFFDKISKELYKLFYETAPDLFERDRKQKVAEIQRFMEKLGKEVPKEIKNMLFGLIMRESAPFGAEKLIEEIKKRKNKKLIKKITDIVSI